VKAAYAEAGLVREDAQIELQLMRNSLSLAEKNATEAQAQIEWLQTLAEQPGDFQQDLEQARQTREQAIRKRWFFLLLPLVIGVIQ